MADHTPEPWKIAYLASNQSSYSVQAAGGTRVCAVKYNWRVADSVREGEANAARIVACVNACAGIPTERLEEIAKLADAPWEAKPSPDVKDKR